MNKIVKHIIYDHRLMYDLVERIVRLKHSINAVTIRNNGYGTLKKDFCGRDNVIKIGENSFLNNTYIKIHGNNNSLEIDQDCILGPRCRILMEGNNISIHISKGTTVTRDTEFCAQEDNSSIIVGEDCMFSNNIVIRTSDSHPIYNADHVRINPSGNVKIGNHVWFCPDSKIVKGGWSFQMG